MAVHMRRASRTPPMLVDSCYLVVDRFAGTKWLDENGNIRGSHFAPGRPFNLASLSTINKNNMKSSAGLPRFKFSNHVSKKQSRNSFKSK